MHTNCTLIVTMLILAASAYRAEALPPPSCPVGSVPYQLENVKSCLVRDGTEKYMEGPFQEFQKGTNRVTKSGTFKQGKIDGDVTEYYPSGEVLAKYETKNEAMTGKFEKFYESGKKRSVGQMTEGNPSGAWQFWDEDGKLLAEGDYEKVSAEITKYDAKAKAKRDAAQAKLNKESQKREAAQQALSKKNWTAKKIGGVDAYYDTSNKLYWSGWLGQGKFFTALQKCKGLGSGWHLPSRHEWAASLEAGMANAVPEMNQMFWSSTDQAKETDAQSSMMLGEKSAWAVGMGSSFAPFEKKDEIGVRCVRK